MPPFSLFKLVHKRGCGVDLHLVFSNQYTKGGNPADILHVCQLFDQFSNKDKKGGNPDDLLQVNQLFNFLTHKHYISSGTTNVTSYWPEYEMFPLVTSSIPEIWKTFLLDFVQCQCGVERLDSSYQFQTSLLGKPRGHKIYIK